MSGAKGKRFTFWIRLAIGLTLLFVLMRSVDLGEVRSLFADTRWLWVLVSCVIIAVLRVLMSMRWQVVLASHDIHVSLWELVRITFISMFIGQFLPGSIGPDVIRGYELISRKGKASNVASTLLLDRFIGVYSMFCLALLGAVVGQATGRLGNVVWPLVAANVAILVGWIVGCLTVNRLKEYHFREGSTLETWWRRALKILVSVTDVARMRRIFAKTFALSLGVQFLRCVMFMSLYLALGGEVSIIDCVAFVPLVYVAVLIPISVGGLGVREGTLIYLFGMVGVPKEISISVGLLSHVLQLVVGLPGLIPFLFDKRKSSSKEAHVEDS